jgi:hypothetical protein
MSIKLKPFNLACSNNTYKVAEKNQIKYIPVLFLRVVNAMIFA